MKNRLLLTILVISIYAVFLIMALNIQLVEDEEDNLLVWTTLCILGPMAVFSFIMMIRALILWIRDGN